MRARPASTLQALRLLGILLAFCLTASVSARAAVSRGQVFNVLDYGAKSDASELATRAFQRAIADAHLAGGGTIYVPAGRYISGPIELLSNMTLDLDAGATISFPVAPLPFVKGRYLGVEALVPMPLIGGHDVENVTVAGRGVLTTGDFQAWGKAYGAPAPAESGNANGPLWQHLLDDLQVSRPVSERQYRDAARELRPSFICFTNAKNVLIQDLRIVGGPTFVVHLLYSENATVRNVMIEAYPGAHANGIVVDSSRFVQISDDYIDTGDDGIAIKSGKDADGLRVNRPSENVAITNCTVHHAHGAVVIGSETSGGVRNVVASNITVDATENGIRIKSRRGRGGTLENLRFDNWAMENVGTGIVVTSYYIMGGESPTTKEPISIRTPIFRNIGISNVSIEHATKTAIDLEGLPEMPIAGLRLVNIVGSGRRGLVANHTDAMELHQVELNSTQGPAFTISTASALLLDDVTSSKPLPNAPVIRLAQCPRAIVENSRAFPGTTTFLATDTGDVKNIHLSNDVMNGARIPEETELH